MHAELGHFALVEHRCRKAFVGSCQTTCFAGQVLGCTDISGQIHQLTRQIGALACCSTYLSRCPGFGEATGATRGKGDPLQCPRRLLALIQSVAVLVMRQRQLQAELFDQRVGGSQFGCQRMQGDNSVRCGAGDEGLGCGLADFLGA